MTNYQLGAIAVIFNVGGRVYAQKISLPKTVLALQVLTLFLKQGLIQSFSVKPKTIEVKLKYFRKKPLIKSLELISTPGHRRYCTLRQLSCLYNGHSFGGFYLVSTSKGLYTSTECLTVLRSGGELLLKVILN